MQQGGMSNVLLQVVITALELLLGGLFFFTFKPIEEGHYCILPTMLTFKVSNRYNVQSPWQ